MSQQGENILLLHTSPAGTVWYGNAKQMVCDSGLSIDLFTVSPVLRGATVVRVLGLPDNAALISRLYLARRNAGLPADTKVQLGSPAACRGIDADPQSVLSWLWYASHTQGEHQRWVDLGERDYPVYALPAAVIANGGRADDKAKHILKHHPAWPALSFLPNPDLERACLLLSVIVDPRWFVNPYRPDRCSCLFEYLGLTRPNIAMVCGRSPRRYGDQRFELAELTVRTWKPRRKPPLASEDPRMFLYRIALGTHDIVHGVRLATRRFVRFLHAVWLHERQSELSLFVPDLIFNSEAEIRAYREHRDTLSRRRGSLFDTL